MSGFYVEHRMAGNRSKEHSLKSKAVQVERLGIDMMGHGHGPGPGGPGGPRGPRPGGRRGGGFEEFQLEQMEKETEEMLRVRYLNDDNAKFERTGTGFLSLRIGEEFYPRVQVVRMFPFSDKDSFISIRTSEERSKEIGIVEKMSAVSAETSKMLQEQLTLHYFTPVIKKIKKIKDEYGFAYWNVVTDHGECNFTIRMGGNSVIHLSDTRILIMDIDENRFEIPDVNALTANERKRLDLFL